LLAEHELQLTATRSRALPFSALPMWLPYSIVNAHGHFYPRGSADGMCEKSLRSKSRYCQDETFICAG